MDTFNLVERDLVAGAARSVATADLPRLRGGRTASAMTPCRPAKNPPPDGGAVLSYSLQSALLFGVFETARLIGRLGPPLLFLGELSGLQSRRLSPVELVDALVGHRLRPDICQGPHQSADAVRRVTSAPSVRIAR